MFLKNVWIWQPRKNSCSRKYAILKNKSRSKRSSKAIILRITDLEREERRVNLPCRGVYSRKKKGIYKIH